MATHVRHRSTWPLGGTRLVERMPLACFIFDCMDFSARTSLRGIEQDGRAGG